ncbi:MAG: hypothetical protein ABIJ47_01145 [Candidatus Bathyarchaeota archaeon]
MKVQSEAMSQPQLRMHQTIGGYTFEGPYMTVDHLPSAPGLYAVVCSDQRGYYLLDVGYSSKIRTAVKRSTRRQCWENNRRGVMMYAFLVDSQLDETQYRAVEKEIRRRYPKLPCGQR